jgi:2-polyprenyl-3-methyl-5-hydroxy-6-metoxy-1,4-benzoquinol methylase
MPMRLHVDPDSGRLVQLVDAEVRAALDRAYAEGSQIGTPLSDTGLGRPGLDDVVTFVAEALDKRSLDGAHVLEIGCGSGALLTRMVNAGATAIGVEPGGRAAEQARSNGLEVIVGLFDPGLFEGRSFDLIVHHGVLEHVADPVSFLRDQFTRLADDGIVVGAVPDCSVPMASGDLSMLVHEHLSYFSAASLRCTGALAGGRAIAERPSRSAGSTYCAWAPGGSDMTVAPDEIVARGFLEAAPRSLDAVQAFARRLANQERSLGVFVPGRFINYQALTPTLPALRYFDDDPNLRGRYYPPFDVPVESRAALLSRPVDELLVMSWTFGERLAEELRACPELAGTTVHTLAEILGTRLGSRRDDTPPQIHR